VAVLHAAAIGRSGGGHRRPERDPGCDRVYQPFDGLRSTAVRAVPVVHEGRGDAALWRLADESPRGYGAGPRALTGDDRAGAGWIAAAADRGAAGGRAGGGPPQLARGRGGADGGAGRPVGAGVLAGGVADPGVRSEPALAAVGRWWRLPASAAAGGHAGAVAA